jgi:hypothetical protein
MLPKSIFTMPAFPKSKSFKREKLSVYINWDLLNLIEALLLSAKVLVEIREALPRIRTKDIYFVCIQSEATDARTCEMGVIGWGSHFYFLNRNLICKLKGSVNARSRCLTGIAKSTKSQFAAVSPKVLT